jgi:Transposase, Mutator family
LIVETVSLTRIYVFFFISLERRRIEYLACTSNPGRRDRNSSFEPQLVRKGQRHFQGFVDKILALYSRGLSTRDNL